MKLTLQIQVLPDKSQADSLRQTIEHFNSACSWLAEKAFHLKTANKVRLQQLYYRDLRNKFSLSAQMAVRVIAKTCEAFKRDRNKLPRFKKHGAIPYDQRLMSFKGVDRVSLLTLRGRVIVPIVMGKYQRERFTAAKGQCDLVLRKDGKWFLLACVDLPDKTPIPRTDFIGVDFGVVNIATDSDGEQHPADKIEACRIHFHERRKKLQTIAALKLKRKQRPQNVHRALQRISGREARLRKDINHCISKQLVAKATDTKRGIAIEDLKGIRKRTRFRKKQRAQMSSWSFYQLRTFLEYKARLAGVEVKIVDPRNTSRTCPECGHCEKKNRPTQEQFRCRACGYSANADVVGALNIRARAKVNVPMESNSVYHAIA
jgi:IS605 OrfB family transposase